MALNYALSGTATTGASGATSTYQTYLLANVSYSANSLTTAKAYNILCDIKFALAMGANGEHGVWTWTGRLSAYVTGGGVNEVRKMAITISPSSPISYATTIPTLS